MDKTEKAEIIKKFGGSAANTGSSEVQIALLTRKISEMTEHLKANKKDNHSRRGLIAMVNRRRKLMSYLKRKDFHKYNEIAAELNIKKR
jgi:small subunit ribosomal protein S15